MGRCGQPAAQSQCEIFGPILPVPTYETQEEVAGFINGRDRLFAICPFTNERCSSTPCRT